METICFTHKRKDQLENQIISRFANLPPNNQILGEAVSQITRPCQIIPVQSNYPNERSRGHRTRIRPARKHDRVTKTPRPFRLACERLRLDRYSRYLSAPIPCEGFDIR